MDSAAGRSRTLGRWSQRRARQADWYPGPLASTDGSRLYGTPTPPRPRRVFDRKAFAEAGSLLRRSGLRRHAQRRSADDRTEAATGRTGSRRREHRTLGGNGRVHFSETRSSARAAATVRQRAAADELHVRRERAARVWVTWFRRPRGAVRPVRSESQTGVPGRPVSCRGGRDGHEGGRSPSAAQRCRNIE